jgi:hypothetical protein
MTGGCPVDAHADHTPGPPGGHAAPVRGVVLFAALALLVMPLFAHGCHGDDVDHEPGAVPPTVRAGADHGP